MKLISLFILIELFYCEYYDPYKANCKSRRDRIRIFIFLNSAKDQRKDALYPVIYNDVDNAYNKCVREGRTNSGSDESSTSLIKNN